MVPMKKIIQLLSLGLAFLTLGAPSWAKIAGSVERWQPGHSQDMALVIGLTADSPPALKQRWEDITKVFAKNIDNRLEASACQAMIKMTLPKFSWHGYGHRIFFHWGFNTLPRSMDSFKKDVSAGSSNCENALTICLEEALQAEPEDKRAELEKHIWDRLRIIQASRNRRMMSAIPASDRDTKNSIAAILYDVHLLGDYIDGTEETCKALYPLCNIQGDIINAVNRMRVKDNAAKKVLVEELKKVSTSGSAYMSKDAAAQKAEQLLKVLIAHFPEVVRQSPSYKKLMEF